MKVLVVGGTFDNNGGRRSGLVEKFVEIMRVMNGTVAYRNGGNYNDLIYTLENCVKDYDVVFWWANVSNDLPKVRDVKEVAPHIMLVSSKRNDNDKYTFQELVARTLAMKANLTFEFKKQTNDKFHMMVFDPLGCVWYDGSSIQDALLAAKNRLTFLMSITRNKTYQAQTARELVMAWYFDQFKEDMKQSNKIIDVPNEEKFVSIVKNCAEIFQTLMPGVQTTRFLGNASMRPFPPQVGRCGKGMPSFRKDGFIFVSERNVDKQFLTLDNFIPTYMEDGKIFYCGNKKPSVDTPVQLRLYDKLPNINYMIHSHCYIEGAPFTNTCIPCGAVEETDEVINTLLMEYDTLKRDRYVINLIGHGSIVMSGDLNGFSHMKYYSRPMPEKMK